MRAVVSPIFLEPPGCGRADGRAGIVSRSHDHLGVDEGLCTRSAAPLAGSDPAPKDRLGTCTRLSWITGRWLYLFRAVDSGGQTVDFYLSETRDREAAECFLKRALANADNRPPHVFARDKLRSYSAAIRELQSEGQLRRTCRQRTRRYSNNRIESDHRHVKRRLRTMQGLRTMTTACCDCRY